MRNLFAVFLVAPLGALIEGATCHQIWLWFLDDLWRSPSMREFFGGFLLWGVIRILISKRADRKLADVGLIPAETMSTFTVVFAKWALCGLILLMSWGTGLAAGWIR